MAQAKVTLAVRMQMMKQECRERHDQQQRLVQPISMCSRGDGSDWSVQDIELFAACIGRSYVLLPTKFTGNEGLRNYISDVDESHSSILTGRRSSATQASFP